MKTHCGGLTVKNMRNNGRLFGKGKASLSDETNSIFFSPSVKDDLMLRMCRVLELMVVIILMQIRLQCLKVYKE